MIYKIKVGKEEITVQANSIESAEAWVAKKHGKPAVAVIAPDYPEVEVTATPVEEIEEVELDEEDLDEWDELEDEADSNNS
jgi:hypothetical protein|tara:strand:+ start:357 stop:599 length:243 start_codon:yes stop_codon:yes gene_type:complete